MKKTNTHRGQKRVYGLKPWQYQDINECREREMRIKNKQMTLKEAMKLERIAEYSNWEAGLVAMKKLREYNPTYHYCPDWDEAVICDKSNEWECCTCDIKLKPKQTE